MLRNQLTHGLAPIAKTLFTTYANVARTRGRSVVSYGVVALFPEGAELEEWTEQAAQKRAVELARDGLRLATYATATLADLVGEAGALAPPQVVYLDEETGALSLERP